MLARMTDSLALYSLLLGFVGAVAGGVVSTHLANLGTRKQRLEDAYAEMSAIAAELLMHSIVLAPRTVDEVLPIVTRFHYAEGRVQVHERSAKCRKKLDA